GLVDAPAHAAAGDAGDVRGPGARDARVRAVRLRRARRPAADPARPARARRAGGRAMRAALALALALAGGAAPAPSAAADPLRLRADALASTASPAGLLVLDAGATLRPGLSAEAVVWLAGARTPGEDTTGDVLVIALRGQTRSGRLAGRAGRFVSSLGAVRPAHVDGGALRLRLPRRFDLEAVAGVPVEPGLEGGRA